MRKFSFRSGMKAMFLLGCLAFMALPLPARAGIAVTQKIILIEGRDRFAETTLINSGDDVSTYELSWRFFQMEENTGDYKSIPGSMSNFNLSKHIVFTPKRITVPAHSSQKVRLALRLTDGPPPPGEYRAHLEFRELPKAELPETETDTSKATVGVKINVGFSIPVVYRVGESDATAKIGAVTTRLNKENNKIEVVVPVTKSSKTYSVLGNLLVYYHSANGPEVLVGQISNANIFAEVNARVMPVTLNTTKLESGSLHVVYKDFDETKDIVYDETMIPIGK